MSDRSPRSEVGILRRITDRIWHWLGVATYPPGLYRGPYWWRSLNAWWLSWWGWCFFYSKPWRPGSVDD